VAAGVVELVLELDRAGDRCAAVELDGRPVFVVTGTWVSSFLIVPVAEARRSRPWTACAGVAVAFPITGLTAAGFALLAIGTNRATAANTKNARDPTSADMH
jgi:hypothetical protein